MCDCRELSSVCLEKEVQAVPRRERQEHSLVNVNGVPNSNLSIFNRLSFQHTRDRSEKGQLQFDI